MKKKKKKRIREFVIDKMVFSGKSEDNTTYDRRVLLDGGIIGQRVEGVIQKQRENLAKAKILNLIEKSPFETENVCKNYGKCGGCSMLSVPYDKQVELKKDMLRDLFLKAGHLEFKNLEVLPSPINKGYKNKMEFSFGDEVKDGEMTLGLHKKGSYMSVVTTDDCHIVDEDYRKVLISSLDYFKKRNIPFYNSKKIRGYLRHLVIRKGFKTNEIQINLVTTSNMDLDMKEFVKMLLDLDLTAKIKGILHTINDTLADTVNVDKMEILYGDDFFYDEILGKKFKISPFSFFQTNSLGAELLYKTALDMVENIEGTIFDLYSGTGTIGIILAEKVDKVISIEIVEEAVEVAKENARTNNVKNIEFIMGDVKNTISNLSEEPDLIILDPPRGGMTPKALMDTINFNAEKILYISCNPKKLAEDLVILKENNYKVDKIKAVDMFPNTNHVETIALIQKM